MSWFSRLLSGATGDDAPAGNGASPAQDADIRPGDKIANEFEVVDLIGEGAFGAVYLCRRNGEQSAVKVLRRLDNADDRQRIREEGRRWVELGLHANIVVAYGVREHARAPCVVMEYVEGARTLSDFITAGGDWKVALWTGAQTAIGLEHAWKTKRLLHRDIKPANVLVAPGGIAKIGDFGLATSARLEADDLKGARIGTPLYMAPEIWDGAASDPAIDVYAFGVTFYQAACGQWPYAQSNPRGREDVIDCHRHARATDLRALAPQAPARFCDLIMACLEKTPSKRPRIDALARDLDALTRAELGQSPRLPPSRQLSEGERLTNLSGVHLSAGDVRQARIYAEQATRAAPNNAAVWTGMAAVQWAEARVSDAIRSLQRGLAASPDPDTRFQLLRDLAQGHYALQRADEARDWLAQAIQHAADHDRFAMMDGRSELIVSLLPYDDALYYCDCILKADPNAVITWNNRAVACRRNGDIDEAERCARRAIDLNPLYAKGWTNLANALFQQGQVRESIDAAKRSIAIEPKTGGAYLALYNGYTRLGDDGAARRALNEGARLLPEHPMIQQALAHIRSRR